MHSPQACEDRPVDRRQIEAIVCLPLSGFGHRGSLSSFCFRGVFDCWWRSQNLEGLTAFVHSQQVGHQLSRHLQSSPIGMAQFQLSGMQCGQLRIPARRQLGRFDQHCLEPGVSLF